MTKRPREPALQRPGSHVRIAPLRKAAGMTQQELADAVGAHLITISRLERGEIKLTEEWMRKLAGPLGLADPSHLMGPDEIIAKVNIEHFVDGKGQVIEADESDFWFFSGPALYEPDKRWIKIEGEALFPWYRPRDNVAVRLSVEPVSVHIGRLGLAKTAEGEEYLGLLTGSSNVGTFEIHFPSAAPVRGKIVTEFSPVVLAVFSSAYVGKDVYARN